MKVRTHFHLAKLSLKKYKIFLIYRRGNHCFKWDIQNCIEMGSNVCEFIFRSFKNKELCRRIPV